ncbi:MAG: 2-isopropylmalate synthase [Candidatus Omnitrophica bacterium]|nr:2-isopropylmalate synthase [Candidatus Omnitrophota bacterium]
MERVIIFDTTLRDGEQSPGASLTSQEKVQIARQLEILGVDVIEAGFPAASPGDAEAVTLVSQAVQRPSVCALARCHDRDIEVALKSLEKAAHPRLHLFLATSEIHRRYKLGKAKTEILRIATEKVSSVRKLINDVEFSPEDASRTEPEFLLEVVLAVVEAGACTVNIPDTVGYAVPEEFGTLIDFLASPIRGKNVIISVHCHNDLGLAVSNSLAALKSGARQVECTINGIGERAGNASLEEIVMNLHVRKDYYQCFTNINTREIYRTSRLVSSLTGIPVQPNKAIVGENAFRHEAGIHQDGILKKRETYEIMSPQLIGLPQSELVLGKHSGRHALSARLKELGLTLTEEQLERIFRRFKLLADRKKEITDLDLIVVAEEETIDVQPVYQLDYFHILSGSSTVPSATVRLKKGEEILEDAARGDGPVDALYKTIDRIIGLKPVLKEYKITAITGGQDAQGEVSVCLEINGAKVAAKGVSTDILEASAKAYLTAINQYLRKKTAPRKAGPAT